MNNPKVSILIPAYNVDAFLSKCLGSVLSQTFKDFEVILVNDGSTDGTAELCNEFAVQDNRIKVFHKQNEGISATREFCLKQASGEYIQFIDADDWITPNMLESMYNASVENNADVVGCNFTQVCPKETKRTRTFYSSKDSFLRAVISNEWGVLWKILVKRSVVTERNIHFPLGINGGEDYFFVINVLLGARKTFCIDEYCYFYNRLNENSTIATPSKEKVLEQISATKMVEAVLKKEKFDLIYHKELDIRKFQSKFLLAKYDFPLWMKVFPETSSLCWKARCSRREKLRICLLYSFYKVAHSFFG